MHKSGSLYRFGLGVACAALAFAGLCWGPGSPPAAAQVSGPGSGRSGLPAGAPVVSYPGEPAAPPPVPRAEISGRVQTAAGTPAAGVEVRFWPRQATGLGEPKTATTDPNGVYTLSLVDGTWVGSACGSEYVPGGWEVAVADGRVRRFQEAGRLVPEIHAVEVAGSGPDGTPRLGDPIALVGTGFGCSGRALVEYPGLVQVAATEFSRRDDGKVRFVLPPPPEQTPAMILRELRFRYERCGLQSAPAVHRVAIALEPPPPQPSSTPSATPASGGRRGILSPALTPRRRE